MKPMFRRRLSPVSKMVLTVAHSCAGECDLSTVPTVFGSRHGETSISFGLLQQLSSGAPVSPTRFGLSVHNAASGLFSLAHGNRAPTTSLAGMRDTFFASLLESFVILATQSEVQEVLMVCADASLPEAYDGFSDELTTPYAVAMVLSRAETADLRIERREEVSPSRARRLPDALEFLRWLLGDCVREDFVSRSGDWAVSR